MDNKQYIKDKFRLEERGSDKVVKIKEIWKCTSRFGVEKCTLQYGPEQIVAEYNRNPIYKKYE
jgi:hypothetical protein